MSRKHVIFLQISIGILLVTGGIASSLQAPFITDAQGMGETGYALADDESALFSTRRVWGSRISGGMAPRTVDGGGGIARRNNECACFQRQPPNGKMRC